ncbi:MAG TPA: hypothetical protein VEW03_01120 [Longimicrobiaceae bacterium]|nr:hypothetical protein [Longimicrobiaceae bacterium]
MLAILAAAAIALGLLLVFTDDRVGRFGPRGPESGAALSRTLGLILLVGGGLAFLAWTG